MTNIWLQRTFGRETVVDILGAVVDREPNQGDPGSVPRPLNVLLNWSGELERLSPAGNR